ncbi:MAG: hypothetical protein NTV69_08920 [Caldilinea sp.]|nr:hypothetical protein [Caldilinea sp.]
MTKTFLEPFTERLLRAGPQLAGYSWPWAGRLWRERLELDDNLSIWADQTPPPDASAAAGRGDR